MMSTNACPRPPFLPGNEESFAAHVPNHLTEWYHYFREAYDYMERNETITAELKGQIDHLMLQNQAVQQEHENLKTELVGEQQNSTRLQGVVDYQKTQLREAQQQYMEAVMDKHKAINATMPTLLLWERLRRLLPHLPAPPTFQSDFLTLTPLTETGRTSAVLSPRSEGR